MIRAFITTWSLVGKEVTNPIVQYVEANNPTAKVIIECHYPDADANGLPDKDRVLVIVKSAANVEQLKNLTGVKMIPPYPFKKPVSKIPANVRRAIRDNIVNEGIPLSSLSGIKTYGDFLKRIAKHFNANHKGFGRQTEDTASEEFG